MRTRANGFRALALSAGLLLTASLAPVAKGSTAPQEKTVEQYLESGKQALKNKRFGTARKEFGRAIKLKKDSAAAHLLMASALSREGKRKDAVKYAKQAIQLQPDSVEAHYLLARLLFETNDRIGSQQTLNEALKHDPNYAPSYGLKGDMELAERNHGAALSSYETALRLAPSDDEGIPLIRERVEALKHYIEFRSKKDDPSYTLPRLLNRPRPKYTEDARSNRVTGSVEMALLVDETGAVHSVLVFKRLGYGLDAEAVRAARQLRFVPAMKEGKPISYWMQLEVEFNLK